MLDISVQDEIQSSVIEYISHVIPLFHRVSLGRSGGVYIIAKIYIKIDSFLLPPTDVSIAIISIRCE